MSRAGVPAKWEETGRQTERSGPPRGLRSWLPAGSLALIYLVLASAYNVRVPIYEAPDEPAHVGYVDALYRTGQIPDIGPETYEAAGPPLYHGVGAGLLRALGLSAPLIELPLSPDYPAKGYRLVHSDDEGLPYEGGVLSIHVLRLVSTLFGIGTVIFVYVTALLLFPARQTLAWAAGASTALLPQFAHVGSSVMNDTTVAFFSAATVYASLRLMRGDGRRWLLLAAAGLALGFLTEVSMVVAGVVAGMAVLLTPMSGRDRLRGLALLAAAPIATSGWFYIRNFVEFGAVFPEEAQWEAISHFGVVRDPRPLWDAAYRGLFQASLDHSYWFTGIWAGAVLNSAVYQFLDLLSGAALGGLVIVLIGRGSLSVFQQRGLALLLLVVVLAFAEVMAICVRVSFQPQGRYLFIAQPAIAIMLTLGLTSLFQRDPGRDSAAGLILPLVLVALNVGIFAFMLPSAY